MKKYIIETWGCQMNEEDSEKLSGMLNNMGYVKTQDKEDADIIVFNTCCIRENAEFKVYGNLGALKNLKKAKPDLIIAVCGCMMQQEGIAQKIKSKYPFVSLIFGTHNVYKFPELIINAARAGKTIIDVVASEGEIIEGIPVARNDTVSALVTIMYGCNNYCTYCIVPYVRGRERSRKPEDIINEVSKLVNDGFKEITLLGQNVNSYGKDLKININFSVLLNMLNGIEGLERIRFMTSHPKDLSNELIYTIRDCSKVCKHIHLPIQSGSTRILKMMNRNYTKEKYIELVNKIRQEIPTCSITTDIIIGFPSETEDDFNETLDIVEKVKFDSAYTFLYSSREGTPAAKMLDQVDDITKHERFNKLADVLNDISLRKNQEYNGKIVKVLVEGRSKNDNNKLTGRTDTGKLINFTCNSSNIKGSLVDVKVTESLTWSLNGICMKE